MRGDEQQLNASVHNEHDFGQLVDQVAREYGLDPAMFRAQLQQESGAFNGPDAYLTAMQFVGDKERGNNSSLGLGQISQNFLNGGPWSGDGPNNPSLGGQSVTTDQYNNSLVTQLRVAAGIDALRIQSHGGSVEQGLGSYVNGDADMNNSKVQNYLTQINTYMGKSFVQDA